MWWFFSDGALAQTKTEAGGGKAVARGGWNTAKLEPLLGGSVAVKAAPALGRTRVRE